MTGKAASTRSKRTSSGPSRPTGASSLLGEARPDSFNSADSAASETTTPSDGGPEPWDTPSRKRLFDTARYLKQLARRVETQAQGYPDHDLPLIQGELVNELTKILVDTTGVSLPPAHQS